MIRRVVGIYFSPIGGTAKMTERLTDGLAKLLNECSPEHVTSECYDLLRMSDAGMVLDEETVAVLGMPVYVGKVPLPAIKMMQKIQPAGAVTVAAVSYGARTYGNALYELNHYAENNGFNVVGAGAFSVRYKDYKNGDNNRIDQDSIDRFGKAAANKIRRLAGCEIEELRIKPMPLELSGRMPIHGVSRVAPKAAAVAQQVIEKLSRRHRESEWYL